MTAARAHAAVATASIGGAICGMMFCSWTVLAAPGSTTRLTEDQWAKAIATPSRSVRRVQRSRSKDEAVNTWLLFGFTEGADVGAKGDRALFQDTVLRSGGRDTIGYRAWETDLGFAYSPSNRTTAWFGGQFAAERNSTTSPVALQPEYARAFGLSGGFKHKLLDRSADSMGLAVQVAPWWQGFNTVSTSYQVVGGEIRLIADWAAANRQWYGAYNLAYQPQRTNFITGGGASEARLEFSAALSRRITDKLYIGAETRVASHFQQLGLNDFSGFAVFAGPTALLILGEHGYIGAAWSIQVTGYDNNDRRFGLDLTNFERHQFRLKAGYGF